MCPHALLPIGVYSNRPRNTFDSLSESTLRSAINVQCFHHFKKKQAETLDGPMALQSNIRALRHIQRLSLSTISMHAQQANLAYGLCPFQCRPADRARRKLHPAAAAQAWTENVAHARKDIVRHQSKAPIWTVGPARGRKVAPQLHHM